MTWGGGATFKFLKVPFGPVVPFQRQSIYSRLAGYEDVNDAERLSVDAVMRHVVDGRAADRQGASTSQVGRFETDVLPRQLHEAGPMRKMAMVHYSHGMLDKSRQARDIRTNVNLVSGHVARIVAQVNQSSAVRSRTWKTMQLLLVSNIQLIT